MDNGVFPIGDFANFSRTTRDALLHYDKIGLLSPSARRGNHYRYYSPGQLGCMNVIRLLQALGMPLSAIRDAMEDRTPAHTAEMLERQIVKIDEELERWKRARELLLAMRKTIGEVENVDETAVTVRRMPEKAIVLGEANDYSRGEDSYDALLAFYRAVSVKHPELDLNYPVWGVFSRERIARRDWRWPDRYYFDNPAGKDRKPAGLYAVGYARGGYGRTDELYERILAFIDANGFAVDGDAYEEYPLNEISVADEEDYLIRVMIGVRGKRRGKAR